MLLLLQALGAGREVRKQSSSSCAPENLCHSKQFTSDLISHSIGRGDHGVTSAPGWDVLALHILHPNKRDDCFLESVAETNGFMQDAKVERLRHSSVAEE